MPANFRIWFETSFNILYLSSIWWLVVLMYKNLPKVDKKTLPLAELIVAAFALLALGDSGHVGFRILALIFGGPESSLVIAGESIRWIGLGTLATTATVTIFYVLVLIIWKRRFNKTYGWFGMFLFLMAIIRMVMTMLPINNWNASIPAQPWSTYRNIPLMIQGLGVAYLILRDAINQKDKTFTQIGCMILVSFTFFIPVILFVQKIPLIGMLMIPKTLAYIAIAVIAYKNVFKTESI
ncbi:MAG: hypothetical protein J7L35_09420 [Anaerolineales bacterium]|nr:hypothetical protein [Anaerolineales bacterium]